MENQRFNNQETAPEMVCQVCGREESARDGTCPACGQEGGITLAGGGSTSSVDATIITRTAAPASDATIVSGAGVPASEAPVATGMNGPSDDATIVAGSAGLANDATIIAGSGAAAGTSPASILSVGQDFGKRYHILRELGVGGMGAVYQAWDAELGVAVAVKVIRPEVLKNQNEAREIERRFKRELLLARQVTHKSVVRIHDLGEIEGIKYITMSYVEGEDLATVLKREGKLPLPRVLRIARQVVSGMHAAHEAGVVHRDLKPANIMLDGEDNALIMDFGIALSSEKSGEKPATGPPAPAPASEVDASATMLAVDDSSATVLGSASTLPGPTKASRGGTILSTKFGGIVGTIEYMAPEQSRGEPVDQRSDIYTFGLILSDLILGQRKVPPGSTPWNELTTRTSRAPIPLRAREPGLPEAVDALVTKCMQLDPADRFQTTAELAAALDRLDENGDLIPEPKIRRFTPRIAAAAVLIVATLVGGTYWVARGPGQPPKPPDPVSVLIADFANSTQEPVFDGLLEQALAVGVEGATFVSAYPRRDALRLAGQIKPGGHLDDSTAVLVALREGVSRVIAGAIDKSGDAYKLKVRVVNPTDNKTLLEWDTEAKNKDSVLAAVGKAAAKVRAELGDRSANSNRVKDEETFTAASLEAAHAYASGQELQWAGKKEEALAAYQKAADLDPTMGRAYSGMGAVASSLGRRQDAEQFYKLALARTGRMTDREKYRTRSGYYLLTRNTDKAREELTALLKQFPTDSAALSNLALTEFYRRDMTRAFDLGRRDSNVFPNSAFRKGNAALYGMYAGDFTFAEKEGAAVLKLNPEYFKGYVAIGLSQLASGRPADAAKTYEKLATLPGAAAWFGAGGLADLAMYEGRLADAARILEPAIKAEKDGSRQARLLVTLAETRMLQGNKQEAAALAKQALALSPEEGITFLAGRVLSDAGQHALALELVGKLLKRFDPESLAYARVLEGEIALARKDPRKAIERFKTAQQFADSWLGRFGLGRAYLDAGAFAEADSEFDLCLKRRGEATAVLLDDMPTYRYAAPIPYYQARVDEELGAPTAGDGYKTFLALKKNGEEKGLVSDAQRRLNAAGAAAR
jgi:serine/threonine protein kinase/tetratricopeptide (TPR) repeat protein